MGKVPGPGERRPSGRVPMMPIAPLMIEHRLIERMIRVIKRETEALGAAGKVRPEFIDRAVDFIRTYADRCHHGKEEDILFCLLEEKALSIEHRRIVEELKEEHARARSLTSRLVAAKARYVLGEHGALDEIKTAMRELVEFYPVHIEKEDRHFFIPCMEYFSIHEQDDMLDEFSEFDRRLIHEHYRSVVEKSESGG